jgi:hypothetical protein
VAHEEDRVPFHAEFLHEFYAASLTDPECGSRLVHEQNAAPTDDRSRDRDCLTLAA